MTLNIFGRKRFNFPPSKITQIAQLARYLNDAYYTRPAHVAFGFMDLENLELVVRKILEHLERNENARALYEN